MTRPSFRTGLVPVAAICLLNVACLTGPCGIPSKKALLGTPIEAFLALQGKPQAIEEEPGGTGKTYVFVVTCMETQVLSPLPVPPPRPPLPHFLSAPPQPGMPARLFPAFAPSPPPPAPIPQPPHIVHWEQSYILRLRTDAQGLIQAVAWRVRPRG